MSSCRSMDCLKLLFQEQVSNNGKDMFFLQGSRIMVMQASRQSQDLSCKKRYKITYWTPREESQYIQYLKQNMPLVASPEFRKNARIFKKISMILGTRTPIQVKTHHQKMVAKYHTIQALINSFESKKVEQSQSKDCSKSEQPAPTLVDGFDLDFNFLDSYSCNWNRLVIREPHLGVDSWSEIDEIMQLDDI